MNSKNMRLHFINVATLVRKHRRALNMSQSKVSPEFNMHLQYISNIERAICSVPLKHVPNFCEVFKIPREDMRAAILNDYAARIDAQFKLYDHRQITPGN
jgi:hypothetical protein